MALPTCSQAWVRRPSIKAALSWLIQEPEICRRSSSLSSSTITSHQDQLPFIKILKDGFSVHYTNLPMVAVTFIFCIDRVSMYKVFMGSMYNVSCYLKYTYLYLEISNVMVVFKKWHVFCFGIQWQVVKWIILWKRQILYKKNIRFLSKWIATFQVKKNPKWLIHLNPEWLIHLWQKNKWQVHTWRKIGWPFHVKKNWEVPHIS